MPRILVVDDDPDIRRVAERLLASKYHEVYLAESALAAMELLNATPFDALISDANMPHYSGFDLIQTVRNNRRFQQMGVVMLTALRERRDIERAIRAGVDDYIVKPLDPILFLKKVDELFLKKPPTPRSEFHFPPVSTQAEAAAVLKTKLLSVSETGVTYESTLPMPLDTEVRLQHPLFDNMPVEIPTMRVLSSREHEPGRFEIRLNFIAPNEAFIQRLRTWIEQQNLKRGAA